MIFTALQRQLLGVCVLIQTNAQYFNARPGLTLHWFILQEIGKEKRVDKHK